MTPDDAPDDPLDALVDAWQEAFAAGRDVPPDELAAARPDLLPALEEKVRRLRRVAALAAGVPDDTERTTARSASSGPPVTPLPPSLEGTDLGGYRVLDRLGAGGMGEVYRAEDVRLGRQVAVKVMRPTRSADPSADEVARARFVREARAAAALRDDHVCPIFHVGEADGRPFLVMPLLAGESLADRLKRGPLPPVEVARVGREAALGLAAAHAKGLIHRDVKPANLWLEAPTGRVLVLDFGLARSADPADGVTTQGGVVGTPAYMAPEQVDGLPLDARADLFALGAVLYECATGRAAFAGQTLTAILKAVATHVPPPPSAVPRPLSDLVMRLLAKRPEDRPASAEAVAAELASLQSFGLSPTAEYRPPVSPSHPQRAVGWVTIGAALVLATCGVWFATRPPAPDPATPSDGSGTTDSAPPKVAPAAPTAYKVRVDVLVERNEKLIRLDRAGALPLRKGDGFVVEATVDPPAYLYLVWVDPNHDVTPVYPWNPTVGPRELWESRPAEEKPRAKVRLPESGILFHAPEAQPGVATLVALARPTPLDVPGNVVHQWFVALPELMLRPEDEGAAVWFAEYEQLETPEFRRTFGTKAQNDPFLDWNRRLMQAVGKRASGQAAVSFARTGTTQ